jgi:lipopolysaccharide transport system ATP-binding protein
MGDIAIQVQNLGKMYKIGGKQEAYSTFRDVIAQAVASPFKRAGQLLRGEAYGAANLTETIWALKDISFEIKKGEVVGIIGHNGAGKSTLLKILSRITEPTEGDVKLYGRVGALLEVGTGFHGELTGRENVYLNGAILGMHRYEIEQKFDEIVDFSEVEKFIDTPVKHYSTGMRLRLGFSVAAHLEPDILIVDEVLAVGDAAFQKKCLGKMSDVAGEGRTVLFVSHNLEAVISLCSRATLIENGILIESGIPKDIVSIYQNKFSDLNTNISDLKDVERYGTGKVRFTKLALKYLDLEGKEVEVLRTGGQLIIDLSLECTRDIQETNVAVIIYDASRYRLIDVNSALKGEFITLSAGQKATMQFRLNDLMLNTGQYIIGLWMGRSNIEDIDGIKYLTTFNVIPNNDDIKYSTNFPGPYKCKFSHQFQIEQETI